MVDVTDISTNDTVVYRRSPLAIFIFRCCDVIIALLVSLLIIFNGGDNQGFYLFFFFFMIIIVVANFITVAKPVIILRGNTIFFYPPGTIKIMEKLELDSLSAVNTEKKDAIIFRTVDGNASVIDIGPLSSKDRNKVKELLNSHIPCTTIK